MSLQDDALNGIDEILYGRRREQKDQEDRATASCDRAGATRNALQSAGAYPRRENGADSGSERGPGGFLLDHETLIQWATKVGFYIEGLPTAYHPQARMYGGMEHFVFDAGPRWVKITQGSGEGFGFTIGALDGEALLVRAGPFEYLRRLELSNQVFKDDIVLHAVSRDGAGNVIIITSQPDYVGEPASIEFIQVSMQGAFFQALPETGCFYRAVDNIAIFDLHSENAVRNGTHLHVFDAIVAEPDDELRGILENQL